MRRAQPVGMKDLLDPASFERLWRELDEREKAQPDADVCHSAHAPELGVELAQFDCPRCGGRHATRL